MLRLICHIEQTHFLCFIIHFSLGIQSIERLMDFNTCACFFLLLRIWQFIKVRKVFNEESKNTWTEEIWSQINTLLREDLFFALLALLVTNLKQHDNSFFNKKKGTSKMSVWLLLTSILFFLIMLFWMTLKWMTLKLIYISNSLRELNQTPCVGSACLSAHLFYYHSCLALIHNQSVYTIPTRSSKSSIIIRFILKV